MAEGVEGPEYRRVLEALRDQITDGTLPVGTLLPSIPRLEAEHRASTAVVRRALAELRAERLIATFPGVGSKVIGTPPDTSDEMRQIMRHVADLSEEMRRLAERVDPLEAQRSPRNGSAGTGSPSRGRERRVAP